MYFWSKRLLWFRWMPQGWATVAVAAKQVKVYSQTSLHFFPFYGILWEFYRSLVYRYLIEKSTFFNEKFNGIKKDFLILSFQSTENFDFIRIENRKIQQNRKIFILQWDIGRIQSDKTAIRLHGEREKSNLFDESP